jgi:hypothetical protein
MVIVAQLVRALVCGTRGRRFEPGPSPILKKPTFESVFFMSYRESSAILFEAV